MTKDFLINSIKQRFSISDMINIFDFLIKIIEQTLDVDVDVRKCKIAIKVLNAAKNEIQNNIKIPKPTKTEIKVTIDVLKEIRISNISDERERQYFENAAEYFKSFINLYYSHE